MNEKVLKNSTYFVKNNQTITVSTKERFNAKIIISEIKKTDTLKVEIKDIKITTQKGGMSTFNLHKRKLNGKNIKPSVGKFELKENQINFGNGILLKQFPSIGKIGMFKDSQLQNLHIPLPKYGGNFDLKYLTKNSTIFFPFAKDRNLIIGDVHALMGDGEICGTGLECDADVKIKVSVIKNCKISNPCIKTKDSFFTVGVAKSIKKGMFIAVEDMAKFIIKSNGLSLEKATMLISIAGNVGVGSIIGKKDVAFCRMPLKFVTNKNKILKRGQNNEI